MNLIDFTKTGGYRFKQFTLRKMQDAYFQILKMFVSFCNIPDTGNFVISGCVISGTNITAGYLYIDGELCRFEQSAGDLSTKIKKNITIESLAFKNGNNEPVFRYSSAVVHATDGVSLSAFTRISPVFDANYIHTDNNFTALLLAKLNGIESGAEVNVQPDYNETNPLSDAYMKNMPVIENILHAGEMWLGDFPIADTQRLTIPIPDVGTSNYEVRLSVKSLSPLVGPSAHDAIATCTSNYTNTSFDLLGKEFFSLGQNIRIYYKIVAL